MTAPSPSVTASVRLATKKDLDRIAEVVAAAFIHDPVFSYFANLKELIPCSSDTREKRNLAKWSRFLVHSCFGAGGRVTVIVEHQNSEESKESPERIVGVACWQPPNKRVTLWKVKALVDAGVFGILRKWGMPGLIRAGFEYVDGSHRAMKKGYQKKGIKEDPDASWYLQLTAVAPKSQGRGYMSKLMHETFASTPSAIYMLEATTTKSRDQYAHLGFELVETWMLGKGKSNAQGLAAVGESAVGTACYSMVKIG